jgi:hypothetical protein
LPRQHKRAKQAQQKRSRSSAEAQKRKSTQQKRTHLLLHGHDCGSLVHRVVRVGLLGADAVDGGVPLLERHAQDGKQLRRGGGAEAQRLAGGAQVAHDALDVRPEARRQQLVACE